MPIIKKFCNLFNHFIYRFHSDYMWMLLFYSIVMTLNNCCAACCCS